MGAPDTPMVQAEQLKQAAFWQQAAPDLHVLDRGFMAAQRPMVIPPEIQQQLNGLLKTEGYFQLPPQQWGLPLARLAGLVRELDAARLPLPFAFVYDEFWMLFFRLHRLIEGVLGPGYMRLPDFWAWLVDPQRGDSGWRPHRDKDWRALNADRSPKTLTLWLPLTDATPLNGCMYLVPADRDPTYATPRDKEWLHKPADIRALPAAAGSVLCWTQAVLHWGSNTSPRETQPRISVAFEFQSGAEPPFNTPLTRPDSVPDLRLRLWLIGKQMLQYKHMYPLAPHLEALARELVQDPPAS